MFIILYNGYKIVAHWQQETFDRKGFQYFIYRIIFNLDSSATGPEPSMANIYKITMNALIGWNPRPKDVDSNPKFRLSL